MNEANYSDTNTCVQAAFADTQNNAVCVHMWEKVPEGEKLADEEACKQVKLSECRDVLGVVTGEEAATYTDLETSSSGKVSINRMQSHDIKHGMIGLATTIIHPRAKVETYFTGDDGLLIVNPELIYVALEDAFSDYFDTPLPTGMMTTKYDVMRGKVRVLNPLNKARQSSEANESRDIKEQLMQAQFPHIQSMSDPQPDHLTIDPSNVSQQRRADAAKNRLLDFYDKFPNRRHRFNEVVANVCAENIAGVVVKKPFIDEEVASNRTEEGIDWKAYFERKGVSALPFARQLLDAVNQLDIVQSCTDRYSAEHLDARVMKPSMFIYDVNAQSKLIHFPPTKEHRAMLEKVLGLHEKELWAESVMRSPSNIDLCR